MWVFDVFVMIVGTVLIRYFFFLWVFDSVGWILAWKLVLVHVPLVQEIFGLRKKSVKPKPPTRHRLSKFYGSMNRDPQRSDSEKPI